MRCFLKSYFPKYAIAPFTIGLFLGIYFFFFKIVGIDFAYLPGDLGDGRFNLYLLEHGFKYLSGQIVSFWDAPFMYPKSNIIALSDNLLGTAPIYSVFRLLGFEVFTAFQCWYLSITALNYITAYLLLMRLFKNSYAAVMGAFVFAFSIALISQVAHAQTFSRFPIPLIILMALKFSENLKPANFFAMLVLLVYQVYCGIYLGFMTAIPLVFAVVFILLNNVQSLIKHVRKAQWILSMLLSIIVSVLLLLPLLFPYLQNKIEPTEDHYLHIIHSVPTIKSHFYSHYLTNIWGFLSNVGDDLQAFWDHKIFAGGVATTSLILAFVLSFRELILNKFKISKLSMATVLFLAGMATFLLYLRFDLSSLYFIVYELPGYSSMRSMTRIINVELLFFSLATSYVFLKVYNKYSKYGLILFVIGFSVLIVDNSFYGKPSVLQKENAQNRLEKLNAIYAKIPTNSVVSYEPIVKEGKALEHQIDGMLMAQKYNLKSLNGYSAQAPQGYFFYWRDMNENGRNIWLKKSNATFDSLYIIISPVSMQKVSVKEFQ